MHISWKWIFAGLLIILLLGFYFLFFYPQTIFPCRNDEISLTSGELQRPPSYKNKTLIEKIFRECRIRYTDAGNQCFSDSDCQGECFFSCEIISGKNVKGSGQCNRFDGDSPDCYWQEIPNGKSGCICF